MLLFQLPRISIIYDWIELLTSNHEIQSSTGDGIHFMTVRHSSAFHYHPFIVSI